MDSPHLGHSQNLEQWDWGGEEQVYSKDAPHLDPLSSSIHFSPFPLLIAAVEEILERGRCYWWGVGWGGVLWEENEEKGEGTGAGKGLGPRVTRKKGFDLGQGGGLVCLEKSSVLGLRGKRVSTWAKGVCWFARISPNCIVLPECLVLHKRNCMVT